MVSLRVIAKQQHPGKPYILLGHSMGSFAAQQFVLDHSHSIDSLALSGSGTLDGLVRVAQSLAPGEDPMKIMNAAFEPARTPFDWLSRDNAEVDAFINDPLCFPSLKPDSMQSFWTHSRGWPIRAKFAKCETICRFIFSLVATTQSGSD
jgi:alpha-beta hydrolase superfamily lysophospholipase